MKILMHFRHFPVAMGRFFHWALEDLGHDVFTVGPYSHGYIPWGDYYFPYHKFPPDYELPDYNVGLQAVLDRIPFKPDFVLQAGDVQWLEGESSIPNVILATDPHAVDYTERRKHATHFVTMQKTYHPDSPWVPYGFDHNIHIRKSKELKHDVVFSGLQYEHRIKALEAMKAAGLNVFSTLGLIYEDYVDKYNEGKIAFNWSSKQDLPARFWEGLAMGRLVLTNRVKELEYFDLVENRDYVAFSSVEEAVEKAKFYSDPKNDNLREVIANSGWKNVQRHNYEMRAKQLLEVLNG